MQNQINMVGGRSEPCCHEVFTVLYAVLLLMNCVGAGNEFCTDLSQINNFKNCVVSDVCFLSLKQTLPAASQ